jgi:hypothetical protein
MGIEFIKTVVPTKSPFGVQMLSLNRLDNFVTTALVQLPGAVDIQVNILEALRLCSNP